MSAAFATITRMSPVAVGPALSFFRDPSNAINVSMILLSLWALTVYAVVMITFAGSPGRALGRLERRFLSEVLETSRASSRRWPIFVSRHLVAARAAAALQRRMLAVVWVCAALATAGNVFLAVSLFLLTRNIGAVPFAMFSLLLAACLPLLATLRLARWLWRGRASLEWQIALLGERLMRDTKASNQQSIAAQRSADVESVLVRRFRSSKLARQPVAEHRVWLVRLQPAINDRAAMVVQDHGSSFDWHVWSTRWLDLVASAFTTATHGRMPPDSDTLLVPDHRTTEQIGLRIANWSVLGLGVLGMTLLLLADHPVDLQSLWSGWDTATGRVATLVTAAGGVVALISVGRSGSR